MKKLLAVLLPVLLTLGACGRSETSASDPPAMPWPDTPFMPQPDPSAVLLPCIPVGTIGLEGTLGREDDTRPAATGPDLGNGLAADAVGSGPADLPEQVFLRTDTETFNRRYQFALRDGKVWFKSNTAVTGIRQPWAAVTMPACLAGTVIGIAVDDDELIAIRADGGIYGMDNALKDYARFNWSSRWGAPLWLGLGYQLPPDYRAWSWTVISPAEDVHWTDPADNLHAVGNGKVSHIWSLRADGQRYTLNDPWLPPDGSYEMCGPRRGQFRGVNLSASGSTIFTVNRYGDLYTRNYDFDLCGDDGVFFDYSYEDQRGVSNPAIQLPTFDWQRQPKIRGAITQNISVHKVGVDMAHRILRVEGEDAAGHTGYWEKDYRDMDASHWAFIRTDQPLRGVLLDNRPYDSSLDDAAPSEDAYFSRNMDQLAALAAHSSVSGDDDWAGELPDFNFYCPPQALRIWFAPDQHLDLILHTVDTIRQLPASRGLGATPRRFSGDIEVPAETLAALDTLPAKSRQFIQLYLKDQRHTGVTLRGTSTRITITEFGWQFESP
ncbi:hypothetical protein [Solimonas variicoloris]|uniref:hypothetical protein n=1 Tax=Solimonas variicoloris TaxID=254408 RepID=UPI000369A920|nr:hypothetical protein [Solimonas variicoloris]